MAEGQGGIAMSGPLSGLRVVVLAGMGPTAFASMLFADFGADVVRIARPPGRERVATTPAEDADAEYDLVNRGVRSVQVDLKDPAGVATVIDLVRCAEVFIEGFRPGVAERLGVGPEALLAEKPDLVYARLTGYGQDGPMARAAGHDINYVAQSGVLSILGQPARPPHPPLNLLGDYAGGGALAAFGIVSAVLHARATGAGQVVDSAMIDGVAMMATKILGLRAGGFFPGEPGTNYLDGGAPYYRSYRCADGGWIAVGAIESNFYQAFLAGLGVETSGWPDQEDRGQWPRLQTLIGDAIAARGRDEWAAAYAGSDACVTAVLTPEEAAADDHNALRGVFHRVGGVLHPTPSPRFSETPARTPSAPTAEVTPVADVLSEWRMQ